MSLNATISLNTSNVIGEINDHLYGANLEHYAQTVYGGHWAEMLQDRKFAGQDHMYIGLQEGLQHEYLGFGVVRPWQPINPDPKYVRFVHDNTTYYTGRQSQRISVEKDDGKKHGISQSDLYIEKDRSYDVRLVLKGEIDSAEIMLDQQVWTLHGILDNWTTFETRLRARQTNEAGTLSITFQGTGTLWIGAT